MANNSLFLTVASQESLGAVKLMIDSLRSFGGELGEKPFWIFSSHPENLHELEDEHTRVVPLILHDPENIHLFERKVTACARAEELAPLDVEMLVWVDPGVVFTAPPLEFLLDEKHDAAFRPVHIRNIGLPVGAPLDAFWNGICSAVGAEDVPGTVASFVDGQQLRTYYNSHSFSIRPGLGLMRNWLDTFLQLLSDVHFQVQTCQDEAHQVFLFQAILSVLVGTRVGPGRVKILPATYNYPYHLQERIPIEKRFTTLNEAVCFTYEDLSVHPDKLHGIGVNGELKAWLEAHAPE